jgi:hypothetical protein
VSRVHVAQQIAGDQVAGLVVGELLDAMRAARDHVDPLVLIGAAAAARRFVQAAVLRRGLLPGRLTAPAAGPARGS